MSSKSKCPICGCNMNQCCFDGNTCEFDWGSSTSYTEEGSDMTTLNPVANRKASNAAAAVNWYMERYDPLEPIETVITDLLADYVHPIVVGRGLNTGYFRLVLRKGNHGVMVGDTVVDPCQSVDLSPKDALRVIAALSQALSLEEES